MPDVDLLGALLPMRRPAEPAALPVPAPVQPPVQASWENPQVLIVENPMLAALYGLAGAVAVGVSYSRNQSVPWAIAHGLVGVPYLAYVAWETKGGRGYAGSYDEVPSASAMFLEGQGVEELGSADEAFELLEVDETPQGSSAKKKKRKKGRR